MIFSELKSTVLEDMCLYVRPDNHSWAYLFDCGQASLLTPSDCQKVLGIFVTHTHIDHFMNFMGIFRHLLGCRRTLFVCGPAEIQKNVQGMIHGITWNLIGPSSVAVEVREILPNEIRCYRMVPPKWELELLPARTGPIVFEQEGIFVRYALLDHRIHSVAYLIEENARLNIQKELPYRPGPWVGQVKDAFLQQDRERLIWIEEKQYPAQEFFPLLTHTRGYALGYVMDHMASEENHEKMKELYQEIDELYIESFYRYIDVAYAQKNYHSTARQSGELAKKARVKKLNLVHHSRRYAGEFRDLLEEGYAVFEGREPSFLAPPEARFHIEDPFEV